MKVQLLKGVLVQHQGKNNREINFAIRIRYFYRILEEIIEQPMRKLFVHKKTRARMQFAIKLKYIH